MKVIEQLIGGEFGVPVSRGNLLTMPFEALAAA